MHLDPGGETFSMRRLFENSGRMRIILHNISQAFPFFENPSGLWMYSDPGGETFLMCRLFENSGRMRIRVFSIIFHKRFFFSKTRLISGCIGIQVGKHFR